MRFKLLLYILLLIVTTEGLLASTRASVTILGATENIRLVSQRIGKNYLYLYVNPNKKEIVDELLDNLDMLVENIRTIAITSNDEETKNILEFLRYSKDKISELLSTKPDLDKASLMLDYSEILLEGANKIAKIHAYKFSDAEKRFMESKRLQYLAERSAKYYMAIGIGLNAIVNKKQIEKAINNMEQTISDFESYNYPSSMRDNLKKLRHSWDITKSLYDREKRIFVSNIVILSIDMVESIANDFILYHRKNL